MGVESTWGNPKRVLQHLVPQRVSLADALGFVWSLPVTSLISGMNEVDMVRENAALARTFEPLSEEQRLALVEVCAGAAGPLTEFYRGLGREPRGFFRRSGLGPQRLTPNP